MATPDPEKRAILSPEDGASDDDAPTNQPPRSLIRPWLFILVGFLVVLSIGATSHRCFGEASSSLFTSGSRAAAGYHAHHRQQGIMSPSPQGVNSRSPTVSATASAAEPSRTVLKTFEVAQPVLMPDGPAESDGSTGDGEEDFGEGVCKVELMRHDFAWSYNAPFVGNYTPPSCEFNRVVLNFSVVSQGRQFDRLAIMYFGDTEVWRTSTAEPTSPPGISWIYLKDMTEYLYFWKSPQKLIFDLGNLIDDKYTGIFNTTMTAIFYKADVETDQAPPSDLIIPISRHGAANSVSLFVLPADNATNTISLPRNIRRAVFSVSANGQATEEFWWSNVLQSDVATFNATAGELPGLSPFREVQVLIDGQLAGVQWPFPVIFTGGVVPSLHRPIVGIHAFDLREHEIDITPFLPLLCDGKQHTFTIRVAGLNDIGASSSSADLTESVNESWYVTGKLFLWLDANPASITTGSAPTINLSPPTILVTRALTADTNGTNQTLTYTTSVQRALKITTADLRTQNSSSSSSSHPSPATWSQSLSYTNRGLVTDYGFTQINDLLIKGTDHSTLPSHHDQTPYTTTYAYPLFCNSTYAVSTAGNLSISAFLRQGKEVSVSGPSVFPSGLEAFSQGGKGKGKGLVRVLETSKEGTAEFRQTGDGKASSGWGDARQVFWFGVGDGVRGEKKGEELYFREVEAVNGTVVGDVKRLAGRTVEVDVPGLRVGAAAVGATEYA